MKKYNGENPQNAGIKISYTGKKPKVRFSYPVSKEDSDTRGSMLPYIFIGLVLICGLTYMICDSRNDTLDAMYKESELNSFVKCAATHPFKTLTNYSYVKYDLCLPEKSLLRIPWAVICVLLLPLVLSSIIYFPFKKKWDRFYPDFKAAISVKKYKKFNKKDLKKDSEGKYYLELPIFDNVICDFKATKQFSKYLEEFEIEEYKFEYNKKRRMNSTKKKQRPKNEFIWHARWYFKEKPTKGFIEVLFK